jgi:hypothetical protein
MDSLNRKDFLKKFGLMGVAAVGATTLITACGGGEQQPAPAPAPAAAAEPCNDLSGLTEQDLQLRANVEYVTETAIPEQRCDNCQLYTAPNGGCGGCLLFAGPVTAAGWCTAWVVKQV